MNATLCKALIALVPAGMLFAGSIVWFFRGKGLCSFLELLGSGCLVVVVLTHVSEALRLFPWMDWGLEHSIGHYLDFWSAVLGLTLFPIGYMLHALRAKHLRQYVSTPAFANAASTHGRLSIRFRFAVRNVNRLIGTSGERADDDGTEPKERIVTRCTSRPDCPCSFCVERRTGPSAREKQDNLAREYIAQFVRPSWTL
jgi:hypothetical protein